VRFQELLPRRPLVTLPGRLDPVVAEDIGDGPSPDVVIRAIKCRCQANSVSGVTTDTLS